MIRELTFLRKSYYDMRYKNAIQFIIILLFIAGSSIGVSFLFPVYFRNDDGTGLLWATTHKILDAFSLKDAIIGGSFRPVNYLFWWIMYHCFGHNAFFYQAFSTFILFSVFYLFYKFCAGYYGKRVAILSLPIHLILFNKLYYVALWFSDVTFTLQMVFIFLSIICYFRSKSKFFHIYISWFFALLAFLTKEPSMIIIISFVLSDLLLDTKKENSLKKYLFLLPYTIPALMLLAISPVTASRPLPFIDIGSHFNKISFRAGFYSDYLLFGLRLIIPVLFAIMTGITIKNRNILFKTIPLLFSIPAYYSVIYFYAYITLASFVLIRSYTILLSAFLWYTLTLFPLFFLSFFTPTYLFEFSFGISLFIGIALHKSIDHLDFPFEEYRKLSLTKVLIAAILILTGIFAFFQIKSQVTALNNVVEARQNFAAAIRYIQNNQDNIAQIVVIDQKIKGDLNKKEYKLSDPISKSSKQQTMHARFLEDFLKSLKIENIICVKHTKYKSTCNSTSKCIMLLQNNTDIAQAHDLGFVKDTLFLYSYFGKNSALICSFEQE
jgi:hypothetical protein